MTSIVILTKLKFSYQANWIKSAVSQQPARFSMLFILFCGNGYNRSSIIKSVFCGLTSQSTILRHVGTELPLPGC